MSVDIYKLKLLESVTHKDDPRSVNGITITRVPGGWIFTDWENSQEENAIQTRISSVFVPFNNEFDKTKPKNVGVTYSS